VHTQHNYYQCFFTQHRKHLSAVAAACVCIALAYHFFPFAIAIPSSSSSCFLAFHPHHAAARCQCPDVAMPVQYARSSSSQKEKCVINNSSSKFLLLAKTFALKYFVSGTRKPDQEEAVHFFTIIFYVCENFWNKLHNLVLMVFFFCRGWKHKKNWNELSHIEF
jgi:hypothetical protein